MVPWNGIEGRKLGKDRDAYGTPVLLVILNALLLVSCLSCYGLFFKACTLSHGRIQDLLADSEILGGNLQQFIRIDEI